MLNMSLSLIAKECQGQLIGDDLMIDSISTDSRQIAPGQLFVALKGERFDGHDYLSHVARLEAGAALVSQEIDETLSHVQVADTRIALGKIAAWQRSRFSGPVAAITGSNGKTTVKEMLSTILRTAYDVLATQGNFNNDIGLPLTLLRLNERTQAMVLELGANHHGEIAYTAAIAKPNIALVNNVGDAHIEGFGSREGVANEKSEIFAALDGSGTAVFEASSVYSELFRRKAGQTKIVTFGIEQGDVRVEQLKSLPDGCYTFVLCYDGLRQPVRLKTPGLHNVRNSCAAAAMALQMGIEFYAIGRALCEFNGVSGRLRRLPLSEWVTVYDDTYNANPNSFRAALDLLSGFSGKTILVAGDMGELGDQSEWAHRQLGTAVAEKHLTLMATGTLMSNAVQMAGRYGEYYLSQEQLQRHLLARLQEYQRHGLCCNVVVKGSRSCEMEHTVQFLQQHFNKVYQC
ncbi:MAG: UDP-N-acetylmuramoyl-tripeptide--D-alanyl-D-alanine ligase [Candidatus Celerinatantimonas neptuna]|nr:MAG: UDP-N-acetylmuramoyl-tripeptide--D-alanyl-D-alanine ligase [Candidatus Celerinatantimonas neptuna]